MRLVLTDCSAILDFGSTLFSFTGKVLTLKHVQFQFRSSFMLLSAVYLKLCTNWRANFLFHVENYGYLNVWLAKD